MTGRGEAEGPVSSGAEDGFIGREDELAALEALWAAVQSNGEGAVALVRGPDGFGRSTLLRRFLARTDHATKLVASGEPDERDLEFATLHQLLRGVPLPENSPLESVGVGSFEDADLLKIGAALLPVLDEQARDGLIIAIDDAALADRQSMQAMAFALRRLRRSPVLAVLTCSEAARPAFPESIGRLLADAGHVIDLGPFGVDDVRELVARSSTIRLSTPACGRLAEASAGSPLLVSELLHELTIDEFENFAAPLPAPATYSDLVARRLASCGDAGSGLVRALAVLGDGTSLRLAGALTGIEMSGDAVDQAVDAGLIVPGSTEQVHFVHPLTGSAIYRILGAKERIELHRRSADLLGPIDVNAALNHRLAASVAIDPDLAEDLLAQGLADKLTCSWQSASERFRAAASVAPPGSDLMVRAMVGMIDCLALEGDLSTLDRARAAAASLGHSAIRSYTMGRIDGLGGDWTAAAAQFDQAWELVDRDAETELAARICGEAARSAIVNGRGARALEWLATASRLGVLDQDVVGDQMALWALAMGIMGRTGEALDAMALLPELVGEPSADETDLITGRAVLRVMNNEPDRARRDLSTVVRVTRHRGPLHVNLFASQYLSDVAYRLGDWDESIVTAQDAIEVAVDFGNRWALPMLHAVASYPLSARGEFDQAQIHADAATAAIVSVDDLPNRLWVAVAHARLAQARRDPAAMVRALAPMNELIERDGIREPGVQPWHPLFAEGLIGSGETDRAFQFLDLVSGIVEARHLPVARLAIERERVRGLLTVDPDHAVQRLVELDELARSYDDRPFEIAQFELVQGRARRLIGDRHRAVSSLRRAESVLERLGARPWVDEVRRELAACGEARTEGTPKEVRLTPHELRVARLVAQGLSNREAADELAVSVKTIGYHLANIYGKLGVHSRVQMVAALRVEDR